MKAKNSSRIAVYTVITGDYDKINELKFKSKDLRYICFTNSRDLVSKSWEIIYIDESLDNHMLNRKLKLFPYKYIKDVDVSLYVDGNIIIKKDLSGFFEKYITTDLVAAFPEHMDRNCLYEESQICIEQKKDKAEVISAQMRAYREEGFPSGYGLYENNIILRNHHSDGMKILMENWWEELNNKSKRDQLSLCYCIWKNKTIVSTLHESSRKKNDYFDIALHNAYKEKNVIRRFVIKIDMNKHKNIFYKALNLGLSILRKLK